MSIEADPNILGKALVNQMTNYQRNQWAKAGYPGLKGSNYTPEEIEPFVKRTRKSDNLLLQDTIVTLNHLEHEIAKYPYDWGLALTAESLRRRKSELEDAMTRRSPHE